MPWWYHTSSFYGWGDTYFQQLAVLGTAQQKKNNTKEREAEIRGGLQELWLTQWERERKERSTTKRERWQCEEAWGQVGNKGRQRRNKGKSSNREKISKSSQVWIICRAAACKHLPYNTSLWSGTCLVYFCHCRPSVTRKHDCSRLPASAEICSGVSISGCSSYIQIWADKCEELSHWLIRWWCNTLLIFYCLWQWHKWFQFTNKVMAGVACSLLLKGSESPWLRQGNEVCWATSVSMQTEELLHRQLEITLKYWNRNCKNRNWARK